jgi:hypothetical protein
MMQATAMAISFRLIQNHAACSKTWESGHGDALNIYPIV